VSSKPDIYAIKTLLEPAVETQKVELYNIEYLTEYGRQVLRLYIDKEGGITLDDCERVNYAVESVLDANDPIPTAYVLEVSSPGVERKLIKDSHYIANIGKKVEVKLDKPLAADILPDSRIGNQKKFRGVLVDFKDEYIVVNLNEIDVKLQIPKEILTYCRLIYEEKNHG